MDARRFAPATGRNREPILEVLRRVVPSNAAVLEIASGSGEHAIFFATRLAIRSWQPSDVDEEAVKSVDAWRAHEDLDPDVVRPAIRIDVTDEATWKNVTIAPTLLFCANMIHIAPFECTVGLFEGASRVSPSLERLVLYGPFKRNGAHTAPSNAAFDQSLKSRDPSWGVRDLDSEVTSTAGASGFDRSEIVEMPANNLIVVFDRRK